MENLLQAFSERFLIGMAMNYFYAFTLVMVRMSGLMAIGPIFGQRIVPGNVRILLVLSMAVLITPTLTDQSRTGFHRLDSNHDGQLTRQEMPEQLHQRFDQLLKQTGKQAGEPLTEADYRYNLLSLQLPSTVLDYAWIAAGELALGLVLGLGVFILLSGLQVAGELIDQQTGVSFGQMVNPGMDISASLTGQFLYLLGVTILLVMEPVGGHLLMVSALVETFQVLPVGEAFITTSTIELLLVILQQSFVLGVQVAAPVLACMSLVAVTMGFLGRTVPQLNILVIGFPIRASIGILILALTISGAAEALVNALPETIDLLRRHLTGLS